MRSAVVAIALFGGACGSVSGMPMDAHGSADAPNQAIDGGTDAATCAANPAMLGGRWRAEQNLNDDLNLSTATQTGGVSYTAGKHGYAFIFNGTSQYVAINDADRLWPAGSYSLEAWVKTTSTTAGQIIEKFECQGSCPPGVTNAYWGMSTDANGYPSFVSRSDAAGPYTVVSDTVHKVNDGQWHHLVGVRDVTALLQILYVDGTLGVSMSISGDQTTAMTNNDGEVDPITIGCATGGGSNTSKSAFFAGAIDEVSYYGVALTAGQVAAIYAAPEGECH